jgi:hypothetical protein
MIMAYVDLCRVGMYVARRSHRLLSWPQLAPVTVHLPGGIRKLKRFFVYEGCP